MCRCWAREWPVLFFLLVLFLWVAYQEEADVDGGLAYAELLSLFRGFERKRPGDGEPPQVLRTEDQGNKRTDFMYGSSVYLSSRTGVEGVCVEVVHRFAGEVEVARKLDAIDHRPMRTKRRGDKKN